jgi:predicted ferric reductase
MRPITRRAVLWSTVYLLLALLPLGIALMSPPTETRGVIGAVGAMFGLLALGVFAMQIVISGRHRWFAAGVGFDNILQFHRQTGLFALGLVVAHPLLLFTSDPNYLEFLDPRDDTLRALTLMALLGASIVLIVSSLWRTRLGLSYEWWRALHGVLALFIIVGGLGHALMASHYTAGWATATLLSGVLLIPVYLLIDSRLIRVWRMRQRPWRVVDNQPALGDATTLTLEVDGEHRLDFAPGQYFWITLGDSPFSLQQHPFSIASSNAESGRVAFTAKRLGDFTSRLPDVKPGTRAFIEGPYGSFIPDDANPSGAVLMAGGIGITPIMGILRTFRDRSVTLPLWLIYANPSWDEATFRDELAELERELSLEVIHVLTDPPEGWEGETGYIDDDLLKRRLPADDGQREYFICGPEPMMNAAEGALIAQGVAPTRIFSDHFDIV